MSRGDKYVAITETEFEEVFKAAICSLPGIAGEHFDKKTAFNLARGEVIITASFTRNSSSLQIKGYSGFDRTRGARYGDALRVIGLIKIVEVVPHANPGLWKPVGAARSLDGRTFHTKNWAINLRRRVHQLYEILRERTKDGTYLPTTRDYIYSELKAIDGNVKIVEDDGHGMVVKVGVGKWLPKPEFHRTIKILKALRFRWDPTRYVWYFNWEGQVT